MTLLAFGLVIVAAAGGGLAVSLAMRGLDEWANAPRTRAPAVVAETPAAPAAPIARVAPAQPQPTPKQSVSPREATMARASVRTPGPAKPPTSLSARPPPQPGWEQQQQEYRLARNAYDASERAEGFRWAQAYKVRRRYCRALAQQRTPAFMEGCLQYARGAKSPAADPG